MIRRDLATVRASCSAVAVLASVAVLAACSSSDSSQQSALKRVCSAQASVQTAFEQVVDDVKELNFGQVKTDASAITSALDQLASAQDELDAATKAKIEPELTSMRASLESVESATSLAQASAAIDSAKASFASALEDVSKTADCS